MFDVSILVISYNTKNLTLDCLRSVYEQTKDITFEVIVVDNCSSDGSAQAIKSQFSDLLLLESLENLGFAAANNLAAKKANSKYLLLLNPDTVILKGAVQELVHFAKRFPENKVYGGVTLFADMSLNPTSCWRKPSLWSLLCFLFGFNQIFKNNPLLNPEGYGGWKRDSIKKVDIISGCFLLICKETWDLVGGFDQSFFMYAEDADLCLRVKKQGADPILYPGAKIIHYGGASETVKADKIVRLFKAKQKLLNRHWNRLIANLGNYIFILGNLIRICIFLLLNHFYSNKYHTHYKKWREVWGRREEWLM